MRHIIRTWKYIDVILLAGEWEEIAKCEREITDTCETLEEALESLRMHKLYATVGETFHIGYDDVSLDLENWERDWLNECAARERAERKASILARRNMGLDLSEFEDDWNEEDEFEEEAETLSDVFESTLTYYDIMEEDN